MKIDREAVWRSCRHRELDEVLAAAEATLPPAALDRFRRRVAVLRQHVDRAVPSPNSGWP